jgi:hypothetical protein
MPTGICIHDLAFGQLRPLWPERVIGLLWAAVRADP